VERVEAAMRDAVEAHPNHPVLQVERHGTEKNESIKSERSKAGGSPIPDASTKNEDDLTTATDTTNISHYCK